ncbi:TPA: hypothetical protein ACH3X1_006549 [Trebouxia sp. C0004]
MFKQIGVDPACQSKRAQASGTWGALLNLAERKGRHTAHTWMDFSIGFFLVSLVCGLTLGQFGHSGKPHPNEQFIQQLRLAHENAPLIGFAMASGVCIFFGNMGLMYALCLSGVTIAVPLFSSFIVIVGTTLNYFLDRGLNKATVLFPGVACFFLAFCAGAATHILNETHVTKQKYKIDRSYHEHRAGAVPLGMEDPNRVHAPGKQGIPETVSPLQKSSALIGNNKGDLEAALPVGKSDSAADLATPPDHDPVKSVIYQDKMADQNAPQRSVKLDKSQRMFWGIGVAVLAGVVGSLFSPGFNVVTNDAFHTLAPGVEPLTVYTGYFYFTVPCLFLAFPVTQFFMMYPPLGQPKSSWSAYIKDHGILSFYGFLSGVCVSAANILQFLGGQAAGYAASDLVQANPIVATIWGIAFFKEYRKSSKAGYTCLVAMYLLYIAAVVLLAVSASTRPNQ